MVLIIITLDFNYVYAKYIMELNPSASYIYYTDLNIISPLNYFI